MACTPLATDGSLLQVLIAGLGVFFFWQSTMCLHETNRRAAVDMGAVPPLLRALRQHADNPGAFLPFRSSPRLPPPPLPLFCLVVATCPPFLPPNASHPHSTAAMPARAAFRR